jgi:rubrerythrin
MQNPRTGTKWLCVKCKTWCAQESPRCPWCGTTKPKK